MRRIAEGERQRNASPSQDCENVSRRGQIALCGCRPRNPDDAFIIREIVHTQLDLGLRELRPILNRVVEVQVSNLERIDWNRLVDTAVVVKLWTDTFAEKTKVPISLLVWTDHRLRRTGVQRTL